jgi:hypothetical protein
MPTHCAAEEFRRASAGRQMRVIALIDDPAVVRRILEHLGRWAP